MSCEPYQDALIDLAAKGPEPAGDVRAHLAACPSCRSYLEQGQFLFAAIDSGVHTAANAEIPDSFLARVRVRLAQESEPRRRAIPAWTLASAAVVLILAAIWTLHPQLRVGPAQQAAKPDAVAAKSAAEPLIAGSIETPAHAPVSQAHLRRRSTRVESIHEAAVLEPEVLVPPDERQAFARFLAGTRGRQDIAQAFLHRARDQESFPLAPLQIARLEIEPLESQDGAQQQAEPER
jgi:hypothetical protein